MLGRILVAVRIDQISSPQDRLQFVDLENESYLLFKALVVHGLGFKKVNQ